MPAPSRNRRAAPPRTRRKLHEYSGDSRLRIGPRAAKRIGSRARTGADAEDWVDLESHRVVLDVRLAGMTATTPRAPVTKEYAADKCVEYTQNQKYVLRGR
ncbi:hypothetical protein GCM10027057_04680 [Marisediminicola antarctica]